jgi:DNA-directed RNA polymerase specialized sigma24 family protein
MDPPASESHLAAVCGPYVINKRKKPRCSEATRAAEAIYPALLMYAGTVVRRCGLSLFLTEDVVQEAYLRWYSRSMQFEGEVMMRCWLKTAVRLIALEMVRTGSGA